MLLVDFPRTLNLFLLYIHTSRAMPSSFKALAVRGLVLAVKMAEVLANSDPSDFIEKQSHTAYECLLCSKVYKSSQSARNHVLTIHQQKTSFVCTVSSCGLQFTNYSTLRRHVIRDHGEGQLNCPHDLCLKSFPDILRSVLSSIGYSYFAGYLYVTLSKFLSCQGAKPCQAKAS